MLTYGQKTSQDVSEMTSWDETALKRFLCVKREFVKTRIGSIFVNQNPPMFKLLGLVRCLQRILKEVYPKSAFITKNTVKRNVVKY